MGSTLFTIAKILLKHPKCASKNAWMKKMWYMRTMECDLAITKNEILPFAVAWMDPQGILLSEISQADKDKYCVISHICRL